MEPEMKNNNKKKFILVAVIAAVIALVVVTMVMSSASPSKRLQQQLDLGERYLSELNYEQAIAAYEAALELDPKSADAYIGLVKVYDEQEDMERVGETYLTAKDVLEEDALLRLTTEVEAVVISYADQFVREGKVSEAEQMLALLTEVTGSEVLKKKWDEIVLAIGQKGLVWERTLYDLILAFSYETVYGSDDFGFGFEEMLVSFALRDIDRIADGIPELIVFNENGTRTETETYFFRFGEGVYDFVGGAAYMESERFRGRDGGHYTGLFMTGGTAGYFTTEYAFINENGDFESECVTYIADQNDGRGEPSYVEKERTSDESLYRTYESMGDEERHVIPFYTREEIREMGWEAFLATFGFESRLFSEYAYLPVETKDRPDGGSIRKEDLTEDVTDEIMAFATGLYLGLPEGNYENTDAIMASFRNEPERMEGFLSEYYLSVSEIYWDSQHKVYCYDVPDAEIDQLLLSLLDASYDFTALNPDFEDMKYYGALHRGNYVTAWIIPSARSFHHTEYTGYADTASGTDLTFTRFGHDPDAEWEGDEPVYYETGKIILHLQSCGNRYGFKITGCEIFRSGEAETQ